MGWGSGEKKSGKLAKRRAGEMVEGERGSGGGRRGHNTITCGAELALDLPAKGTGERAEPVGGKIEYESLMRAISAPLPRPSATRFLRRLELSRLPILPVSLFISWPSSPDSLPIFDLAGTLSRWSGPKWAFWARLRCRRPAWNSWNCREMRGIKYE